MAAQLLARAVQWLRDTPCREMRRTREVIALAYCISFVVLGCIVLSFGPAVLDLALQTKGTVSEVGFCLGVRSFAYAVGSLCGPVFDRFPGHLVLAVALAIGGLATALIPAARSVVGLGAIVSMQGFFLCGVDTGANVLLLRVFAGNADVMHPWMQALHFCFALGAWAAPLLLRAVADARGDQSVGEVAPSGTYNAAFYTLGVLSLFSACLIVALESPAKREHGAATPDGAAPLPSQLLQADGSAGNALDNWSALVPAAADTPGPQETPSATRSANAAAIEPKTSGGATSDAASTSPSDTVDGIPRSCARDVWKVVIITALVLGAYVGAETSFGFFATAYAVFGLGLSEAEGQYLTSAYWGAIMLGRLAAVPVSTRMSPRRMLNIVLIGCVVSIGILMFVRGSVVLAWILTVAYGLAMASVYPTVVALVEGYFPILGKHATVFVIGAAGGEWILPFIISMLIGATVTETGEAVITDPNGPGPAIVPYVVAAGTFATAAFYLVLVRAGAALAVKITAAKNGSAQSSGNSAPAGASSQRDVNVIEPQTPENVASTSNSSAAAGTRQRHHDPAV